MALTSNGKYKVLQGCFWMMLCASSAFISLYLQGKGLGTAAIGTFTAVFCVLSAVLQPVLGRLCDRNPRLHWRAMLLGLTVPHLALCCLMLVLPGAWTSGVLIGFIMLLANLAMPFVNVASFYYRSLGENINYGAARGIGSCLYALLALAVGALVKRFGIVVVPVAGGVTAVLFLLAVLWMPCPTPGGSGAFKPARKGKSDFFKRYPAFSLMLLATLIMLTSQNLVNTYLLQIIQALGGGSEQLGVAMAIQAVVEVPVLFSFARFQGRYRSIAMMALSSAGFAVKAALYVFSGSIAMIYLTQFTQMISYAVYASVSVYYAAESVDAEDQVTGQTLMTSTAAAGTVLGSLAGGWLLELNGVSMLLAANVVIALAGVGIAALSYRVKR